MASGKLSSKGVARIGEDDGWQGLGPTVLFVAAGVILLVLLSYRPAVDARAVGMVFSPSMSEEDIIARVGMAGGRVARFGGFGHMAIVYRDDGAVPRASEFGAWFTLSPLIVSACFDSEQTGRTF